MITLKDMFGHFFGMQTGKKAIWREKLLIIQNGYETIFVKGKVCMFTES